MKKTFRSLFDSLKPKFKKGGKFEKLYPVFEAQETVFFQPDEITKAKGAHIRDANDMKRLMVTVIAALVPCIIFGIWNTGYQHFNALAYVTQDYDFNGNGVIDFGKKLVDGQWVEYKIDQVWPLLNTEFGGDPYFTPEKVTHLDRIIFGLWAFVPLLLVSYAVGLGIEFLFAVVRKHPVSEGFLVSGLLIPLIVPPTVPLWEVGVATAFAVVIGKEVFGGTGMNFLNPALTARAFLFFAYPAQLSGDKVWTDLGDAAIKTDVFSGATVLSDAAGGLYTAGTAFPAGHIQYSFQDMFVGTIPGSLGETSALACLLGAGLLILTGVGSWRVIVSMIAGGAAMAMLVESMGADFFGMDNWYFHLVAGGFAFGTVFMATDPVSASHTNTGKYIYGFLAGCLSILVRVVNPAYPEGVMLAILLMNVFAPLIDYFVVNANKKRRLKRATV